MDVPIASILDQNYGTYKGYYAENFVAQELTASGRAPLYSWHGRQSEIEFLLPREDGAIPVEVKRKSTVRPIAALRLRRLHEPRQSLCAVHPPDAIWKIIDCLGLPSRPPSLVPALPDIDDPYVS